MNSTVRSLLVSTALVGGLAVTGAVAFAQDGTTSTTSTEVPTTEAPSTTAPSAETPSTETPPTEAPAPDTAPDSSSPKGCERGHRGEHRDQFDQALADQLGISVDQLRSAREAAHEAVVAELGEPERPQPRPSTQEERDALRQQFEQRKALFDQKLAEQLGISVDDLKAARQAVVEADIAEKVASGEITQEQADRMLEALRNGDPPPFGLGGHGPGGFGRGFGRGPR
jgi:hypothetical protein